MMQRIYHTERRGYITADVYDLGAKIIEPSHTGDELLAPERLPRSPIEDSDIKQAVTLAAKAQPGTVMQLAERCGLSKTTVTRVIEDRRFIVVGRETIAGRLRKVWGVKP